MTASESVQLRLELSRAQRAGDDDAALRIIQRLDEERRANEARANVRTTVLTRQHIEVQTTRALEDEICALCLDTIDAGAVCERRGGRLVHVSCGASSRRTRG